MSVTASPQGLSIGTPQRSPSSPSPSKLSPAGLRLFGQASDPLLAGAKKLPPVHGILSPAMPLSAGTPPLHPRRSPSQVKQQWQRAQKKVQQEYAKEWGGEWGQYRDPQLVAGLSLEETMEALAKVLQSQRKLLDHAKGHMAQGARAVDAAHSLCAAMHV